MKFIPILFSTDMVLANLSGRKIMTRRIVKSGSAQRLHTVEMTRDEEICDNPDSSKPFLLKGLCANFDEGEWIMKSEWGEIGDVLWVREPFKKVPEELGTGFLYKAGHWNSDAKRWKPSIHMPKIACRIFLEITDIRVERLQDISDSDAIREGIESDKKGYFRDYMGTADPISTLGPYASFLTLWSSINGSDSWDENPWVWVITYTQIPKPINFLTK